MSLFGGGPAAPAPFPGGVAPIPFGGVPVVPGAIRSDFVMCRIIADLLHIIC